MSRTKSYRLVKNDQALTMDGPPISWISVSDTGRLAYRYEAATNPMAVADTTAAARAVWEEYAGTIESSWRRLR